MEQACPHDPAKGRHFPHFVGMDFLAPLGQIPTFQNALLDLDTEIHIHLAVVSYTTIPNGQ